MATLNTKDTNGNNVSLRLEHVVFTRPNGDVCCNGKLYNLAASDVKRINEYTARRTARIEADARAETVEKLATAGRFQALLVMAGVSMVRAGGSALRNLREDCFDAARAINGTANTSIEAAYDTAMMGGEPYAVWN